MEYTIANIAGREYKLRMGAREITDVESRLDNKSLLKIIMDERIIPLKAALIILHGSMQKYEHGMTMEKVYDLYDSMIASGQTYTDLVSIIGEVLQVSGFFTKEAAEEALEQARGVRD